MKHSMFSHRARSSRSMGSKLLQLLGESLFHPLFEKMLTAQILQGAGRTYIDGSILIFFLFGFGPYSDPYHGKTGRHTLTSNKICFSKKPGIATLSGTWSDTPAHGKIQYIPVRIPPSPPKMNLVPQRGQGSFIFTSTHVKKQHKRLSKQDCPTGPEDTLWDNLVHDQVFGRSVFTQYWGRPLLSESFYPFFSPYVSMSSRYS